ncbi:MAG: hypothetical protein ACQEXX_25035 [Bacillota bacterium]
MKSLELPIQRPPITCYTYYAYPLSVAQMSSGFYPWFYSQFIQLQIRIKQPDEFFTDFYMSAPIGDLSSRYPLLSVNVYQKDMLTDHHLVDLIRSSIQENKYFYTSIDDFYMPNRPFYKQKHLNHDILIHGYNEQEKVFMMSGFNENNIYQNSTIPYDILVESYLKMRPQEHKESVVYTLSPKREFDYSFNCNDVINQLTDYYKEQNHHYTGPLKYNAFAYGLGIYEPLVAYLEDVQKYNYPVDIKAFHLLWEHKKCMNRRIDYLHELGIIDGNAPSFLNVENRALFLRNQMLKYRISGNRNLLEKAKTKLMELKELEKKSLDLLLSEINKRAIETERYS